MPKKTNDLKPYERFPIYQRILERRDDDCAMTLTEIQEAFVRETGFKISRKMVDRDVLNMTQSFGVIESSGHPKRYYIDPNFSQKYRLDLSESELQILILSLEHMKASSLKIFEDHCHSLEKALDLSLPRELGVRLKQFKSHYSFSYGSYGRPNPWDEKSMEVILQSLRVGRTIECQNLSPYHDDSYNDAKRHFAPLQLSMVGNTPYLLVKDMDDGEFKRPSALRLINVRLTDISIPKVNLEKINIANFSFGGFGGINQETVDISIKCKGALATFLHERIIHPTQNIESLGNGIFQITFKIPPSTEISRFLSSYGTDLLEITPESLLNEVQQFGNRDHKKKAS